MAAAVAVDASLCVLSTGNAASIMQLTLRQSEGITDDPKRLRCLQQTQPFLDGNKATCGTSEFTE
jgi:hypothetical protein